MGEELSDARVVLRAYDELVDGLRAENAALRAALAEGAEEALDRLDDFVRWSEAYPTDVFIEPDYQRAHELLAAGGMTLDAISAGIMRRATEMVGKRSREAVAALRARAALKDSLGLGE